jgi:hypothetical protein
MFPTAKMITDIDSLKVNKAGDTMTGALTITGDLTVDTSTLKVDSANNRVGIGTSTPNGSLHILNSSAGTTPSNYLRIEGSVANNSNYPGIELKGGTLSDGGYPNINLSNGGLAIILQSGFGASSNEQRNQISLNASSGITFLTSTSGTATERVRIDASGNVGIGVTPKAWSSDWRAMDFQGNGAVFSAHGLVTSSMGLVTNMYNDGSWRYKATGDSVSTLSLVGGRLAFVTGPSGIADDVAPLTERFIIDASGQVGIGLEPTSRNNTRLQIVDGIGFPATQVASSDPNTLDDYEEGTFDFGIAFGGASVDVVYNLRAGRYTKIGRVVNVTGQLALTSKGSSVGNASITGLPFTSANDTNARAGIAIGATAGVVFADFLQGLIASNSNQIFFLQTTNAGVASQIPETAFSNTFEISITLTYSV